MRWKRAPIAALTVVTLAGSACAGVGPLDPTGIELRVTADNVVLEAINAHTQLALELPDGMSTIGIETAWRSSAPDVASVDENGRVTAHRSGLATITAEAAGLTASTLITVAADVTTTASMRSNEADPGGGNNAASVTITVQAN